ncbi:MAG: hypothetical protein GYA87_00165 [Christensenellaceae bacterium]|nr:hypothetical protein [Christensenellaceae bacterium]
MKNNANIAILANFEAFKSIKSLIWAKIEEFEIFTTLLNKQITFYAFANALKANNISIYNIENNVIVINSKVIKLAQMQMDGYAYIKP